MVVLFAINNMPQGNTLVCKLLIAPFAARRTVPIQVLYGLHKKNRLPGATGYCLKLISICIITGQPYFQFFRDLLIIKKLQHGFFFVRLTCQYCIIC